MGAMVEIESTENVGTIVSIHMRLSAGNAKKTLSAQDASEAA